MSCLVQLFVWKHFICHCNVKEKATKWYLKTVRYFWMRMVMSLPNFDIYQGTGATNCFKSNINSWCPHFFQGKILFDVRSEIHLVWHNIVSTRKSVWAQKKKIKFRPKAITWVCGNEQLQIVFITEEFLEVAIESWSEWTMIPQQLNSFHTLNPTELSGHYIYIYMYIMYIIYIYIIYIIYI